MDHSAKQRWGFFVGAALLLIVVVSVVNELSVIRQYLVTTQRTLLSGLSDYFDLIDTGDRTALVLTCLFTFVYGFVHSLGPGHGKSAVVFLVSAESISKPKIVGTCLLLNVMQGVVTAGVVIAANQVLSLGYRQSLGYVSSINQWVGIAMMLFGGYLLALLIVALIKQWLRSDAKETTGTPSEQSSRIGLLLYGLRPCTSTSLIALFTLLWFDWSLAAALVVCSFLGSFLALVVVVFTSRKVLDYSSERFSASTQAPQSCFWRYAGKRVLLATFYLLVGWVFWTTGHLQISPIL
ncbi:hypothetical protein JCM19239_7568 [Vibrio variabilis]|uniref:Nickel/cobalt efflux system n=1 Tax=Vibrio variabilis TaxID=990271 RepID=A0ABQ0J4B8_9VIBR|nr:hypothetical protein JCM19239_7568 [Vibrio variabilis]